MISNPKPKEILDIYWPKHAVGFSKCVSIRCFQYTLNLSILFIINLTECVNGQYGDGCENVCGQCADFSQCHHVNGVCLSGCNPGYTGKGCTQST